MINIVTEKAMVIPFTIGVPSKYCIRSVLANKIYFAQENFNASNWVILLPVNIKKIDNPIASELFLNTDEIINAIVASMDIRPRSIAGNLPNDEQCPLEVCWRVQLPGRISGAELRQRLADVKRPTEAAMDDPDGLTGGDMPF